MATANDSTDDDMIEESDLPKSKSELAKLINDTVRGLAAKQVEKALSTKLPQLLADHMERAPVEKEKKKSSDDGALAEVTKLRAELEAERKNLKTREENEMFASQLRKAGVGEDQLRIAINHVRSEGRIKRDEDGRVLFGVPRDGGIFEEVPIENGVGEWLKSGEGKMFAPPKPVAGSSAQPVRGNSPGAATYTDQDLAAALLKLV